MRSLREETNISNRLCAAGELWDWSSEKTINLQHSQPTANVDSFQSLELCILGTRNFPFQFSKVPIKTIWQRVN